MEDFIHHDKACLSTSNFKAAPFKMLQHVTNTRCITLSVGDIYCSRLFRPTRRYLKVSAYPSYFMSFSQQAQSKLEHLHAQYILCNFFLTGNHKHTIICLGFICMYLLPHACIKIFLIYLMCETNWILY